MTFEDFKERHFGKVGTPKRDEQDASYENFRIGACWRITTYYSGLTKILFDDKNEIKNRVYFVIEIFEKSINSPINSRR